MNPKLEAESKALSLPPPSPIPLRAQEYPTHFPSGAGGPEGPRGRGPPCARPKSAPPEDPGEAGAGRQRAG